MIPKTIHYCWFGRKPLPTSVKHYMATWKKHLPNYKIIEWNEDNFDVNICRFTSEAYEMKKYAFVSDFARIYILYHYGGLYLDTDVEILKSFDMFMKNDFFMGYESDIQLGTSVIGSVAKHPLLGKILDYYENAAFVIDGNKLNATPNTVIISKLFRKEGFSIDNKLYDKDGIAFYPMDYFSPLILSTNRLKTTPKTYSIHHYTGTWAPKYYLIERAFWRLFHIKNMKLCLRFVNLIKHGKPSGELFMK